MSDANQEIRTHVHRLPPIPWTLQRHPDRFVITDATGDWVAETRSTTAQTVCDVINLLPALLALLDTVTTSRRSWSTKAEARTGELVRARARITQLERDLLEANARIQTLEAGGHA